MNRRILSFLSEILIEIEGDVYRKSKLTNLWNIPNASLHLEGGVEFKNGKKPEVLLKKILSFGTVEGDLIMDFHVGSGTAAAVAHKMGRQYIGIEQMDYVKTITIERLTKVVAGEPSGISKSVKWQGGGDFVYCELMPYNKVFMERIQSARSSEELLGIYHDMSKNSVLNWYVKPQKPEEAEEQFIAINDAEKQKQLLAELLNKNQLYVHLSEIEDETLRSVKWIKY
ncbi:site-specific DNA-methyltransferase [Candidatus Poribacteria bacterium]|nr:site-specific DNA-methyltransferase [Candidatus Poribacteria bacterium]